ncbi:hypothetical protein [Psychromicrobium xiongbiense]|uniref:hypothetical protein n=1 Tax=Psychromicrobium xiongbiense TaxID=3051184 RepID=UPI0025530FDC|nr:hypothetical protein [Psychromicrobium sp. YIM S02556]
MNETPRTVNRLLLGLFGLLLLAGGVLLLAVRLVPPFASWWQGASGAAVDSLLRAADATTIGSGGSLLWIGVAVLLVLLILGMIAWIANQGRGRTTILAADNEHGEAEGLVSLNGSVAEQLLRQALAERPELLGATVVTYEVKGQPGVKIRVFPRQGVAPQAVAAQVSLLVEAMDQLLGQRTAVLLSIGSAARAKFTRAERVR